MKLNVEFQESDRKKKIKRIIAREGLIIIAVIAIGFISILYIPHLINRKPIKVARDYYAEEIEHKPVPQYTENQSNNEVIKINRPFTNEELNSYSMRKVSISDRQDKIRSLGFIILLLGYPAYLLIRFILWAIKTLKEK